MISTCVHNNWARVDPADYEEINGRFQRITIQTRDRKRRCSNSGIGEPPRKKMKLEKNIRLDTLSDKMK